MQKNSYFILNDLFIFYAFNFRKCKLILYHLQNKCSFCVGLGLGCKINANSPNVGCEGLLFVWLFHRHPSPIYASFEESHEKLWTARSTSGTAGCRLHITSTSFEERFDGSSWRLRRTSSDFSRIPAIKNIKIFVSIHICVEVNKERKVKIKILIVIGNIYKSIVYYIF